MLKAELNLLTPMPLPNSRRGAVELAAIAVIVLVLGIGGLFWKTSRLHLFARGPSAAEIQKQTTAFQVNQVAIDAAVAKAIAAERSAQDEQSAQTRTGQTFVAGTGLAIAGATAGAKSDPHIQLAAELNAKAGAALESAVGPLSPAQQQWVAELIANATSASEQSRAKAERALQLSDRDLRASESREQQLLRQTTAAEAERDQLRGISAELRTKIDETLAEKDRVGGLLDTVLHWAIYLGGAYIFAVYILPLVGMVFPLFAPLATAAHALVAPLGAKALSEAKALGRDACAALHNVITKVEEKAPAIVAEVKAVRSEWITQNDGTAAAHDAALRETQQI